MAALSAGLPGCGQRGPLVLPPKPYTPPAKATAAQTPRAAAPNPDAAGTPGPTPATPPAPPNKEPRP